MLRDLGYEVGSGVMIGIPGQSWDDLADDLELIRRLDLDMIGVGPYILHPDTPMGRHPTAVAIAGRPPGARGRANLTEDDRPGPPALPRANIPSTTALATLNPRNGRERGLQCGANVIMPNVTPLVYRKAYEIYPNKACIADLREACNHCVHRRIAGIGREVGRGRGDSPNRLRRDRSASLTEKGTLS